MNSRITSLLCQEVENVRPRIDRVGVPGGVLLALILVLGVRVSTAAEADDSAMLTIDHEKLVSLADITLDMPTIRREAGLPVGTGRMGSLVWTTPSAMKFQINHADVYASGGASNSFFHRESDYAFGLGFVDIRFVDFGPDVFTREDTRQHLSVYDALLTLEGRGVKTQVLGWSGKDAMAIEIADLREHPQPIRTVLRMLRPQRVRTRSHLALSELAKRDDTIILTQKFSEGDYYCGSALAIRVLGRGVQVKRPCDEQMEIVTAPANGTLTILMAGAATFDHKYDLIGSALAKLDAAADRGFDGLLADNRGWWHRFWSRGFIRLHSDDGAADYVQQHYNYYLYVMASSSRGNYPPRFGGMIWKTGGDFCRWGAKHWWHNLSCYYRAVMESNRMELIDPMCNMYSGMYDSCATAARQVWGSQGIWIPEVVDFDGMEKLPDDIAAEMQDLYLLRKPWEQRSERFQRYADKKHPHISMWNWKGSGRWVDGEYQYEAIHDDPFSYLVHILTTGAKVSYFHWLRYEYTMDENWLRDRAYPMLKGTAEFFRNFPGLKKEADGKYHIHNINNHEPVRGCQDPIESIAAMKGILPLVIRASEILGVDADLRPKWQELLDNLTSLPTNDDADSLTPRKPGQSRFWTAGRKPFQGGRTDWGRLIPVLYYDLCTLENSDEELRKTANASFDHAYPNINAATAVHVLSRSAIAAALMGRADDVQYLIPNQIRQSEAQEKRFIDARRTKAGIMDNRMTMREGAEAIGIQRLGRAAAALQYALLQSVPPAPGDEPVIRVFPAWPEKWNAEYTLAARGGFLVTSSMRKGRIEFVELKSRVGGECRLRNPWKKTDVAIYRNGRKDKEMSGSLLRFDTGSGEHIVIVPKGLSLNQLKRIVQ